jgi:predicted RNA-binding protein
MRGIRQRKVFTTMKNEKEKQYYLEMIRQNLAFIRTKLLWERRKLNWFVIRRKYGFARHQMIRKAIRHIPVVDKERDDKVL